MRIGSLASVLSVAVVVLATSAAFGSSQDTAAVPLPGSLVLLTTGIAALAGASWWLRRK
jgi:hypothetical protein